MRWKALLVRELKEGWIAGAVLNAFARQPLPEESELWSLPNVIITPRIAGITSQKWPALCRDFAIDALRSVLYYLHRYGYSIRKAERIDDLTWVQKELFTQA